MPRSIWDRLLERETPRHVHGCPNCYEHLPCLEACSIEDDLELDDGTPCGGYFVCDLCERASGVVQLTGPGGVAIAVRPGEACPECGFKAPLPTSWDRILADDPQDNLDR